METRGQQIACVRILGAVHAEADDGTFVDLPSASQRRLLAILALHAPRRLRVEWLAEVLEVSPPALRTTVSRVRTTLGTAVIETTATGYALVGNVDAAAFCDAMAMAASAAEHTRIAALQRALSYWNGPALEEFASEPWAEGEVARLTEMHAATVDDLAEALVETRAAAEAVAVLDEQIARYPFRDASWGLLIRAFAASGRQAEALRAFQRYRTLLAEELGTEPSTAVVRVERRVATGWDGLESASDAINASDEDTSLTFPPSLPAPKEFVGRRDELRLLADELEEAESSGVRCVLITGEPGIGKTTLLGAGADALAAKANVLYARCDESGVSLQPFRAVLAMCVAAAPSRTLNEHVAACGGELLRVCPLLATRVETLPEPTSSDDMTERFLTFEAATDLLRRIAEFGPLVVMLDDLQDAEPTTLAMLRHLVPALPRSPILFVLSSRNLGDAPAEAQRLALADLARNEPRRLELSGFSDHELATLVTNSADQTRDTAASVEQLRALTAGNPLFATQLVRHWAEHDDDDVPANLRDIVWSRVRSLDDPANSVVTAASVLGLDFSDAVLARMLELDPLIVVDVLDAAARRGLLVATDARTRSWRFAHALVANALYADIGPAARARLHEQAAHALEHDAGDPRVVVQLAHHCAEAGLALDALRWTLRAGDDAFANLAPAEAAQHYRTAAEMANELDRPGAERADILVRLGDAQHRAGNADALPTLAQGSLLAQQFGAREPLVRAALAADRGFMRLDDDPEYFDTVEAALAATHPDDIAVYAPLQALLARNLIYRPDSARRLAAAHEALDLARQADDPTLFAQVAPAALYALWEPGRRATRVRVAGEAIAAAERTADPFLIFRAHQTAYTVAVESADPVLAARTMSRMHATVRACAEPRLRYTLGLYETFEVTMAGRLDEAERSAGTNLDFGMQTGVPDAFTIFAAQLYVIGSFGGRYQELLPLVEEAANNNPGAMSFRLAYGITSAATGAVDVARDILSEGASSRFSEIQRDHLWTTTIIGYAVLAIGLDDTTAAAELLPLLEPLAAEVAFNGATSQGPIAAYVGKLASLLDRHDEAEDHLVAALDIATSFGWNYHRATTLVALAQNRFGRDGTLDPQADAWLHEAAESCRAGGFDTWLQQVDALRALNPR